jgi:hypothetical protein
MEIILESLEYQDITLHVLVSVKPMNGKGNWTKSEVGGMNKRVFDDQIEMMLL